MGKEKLIAAVVVVVFFGVIGYFFISAETAGTEIPDYVGGNTREVYEWAKTPVGKATLEQVPCYCGCKFEGHKNAYDCFWREDGTFDKHGITCSVCLDIGVKSREMVEQGKDICEIRKTIDDFYVANAKLATNTPMPEGCEND
jgi:hypothetical protein